MKIAVIGAGNGGQALAGYMAALGHEAYSGTQSEDNC